MHHGNPRACHTRYLNHHALGPNDVALTSLAWARRHRTTTTDVINRRHQLTTFTIFITDNDDQKPINITKGATTIDEIDGKRTSLPLPQK